MQDKDNKSAIECLNTLFTDNETRFERHSLASFILDGLSTTLEEKNHPKIPFISKKTNLYHKDKAWQYAQDELKELYDISANTLSKRKI